MVSVRRLFIAGLIVIAGLCGTTAGAADKTKADEATKQVEQGGKKLGKGEVAEGTKETAKGIGNTVVEGSKWLGHSIKEFFTGKK